MRRAPTLALATSLALLGLRGVALAQALPPGPIAAPPPGPIQIDVVIDITADGAAEASAIVEQRLIGNQLDQTDVDTHAVIDGSFVSANGIVLINQAPASQVNQVNVVAIAASDGSSAGIASATAAIHQEIRDNRVTVRRGTHETEIGGASFADGTGYVAVNQAAGPLVNQANVVAVATAPFLADVLADEDMSQVSTNNIISLPASAPRFDHIDDGAFDGFVGFAQIHQSSGTNVNAANVMAIGTDLNALGLGVHAP